jgi:hypothetical protein
VEHAYKCSILDRAIVKCRVKHEVQGRVYKNKGSHEVELIVGLIPVNPKAEGVKHIHLFLKYIYFVL